jgi:hypothetical protein
MDAVMSDGRDLKKTIEWLRGKTWPTKGRMATRPVIVAGMGVKAKTGTVKRKVPCPRCGEPMQPESVMCLACFHASRKERGVGVW